MPEPASSSTPRPKANGKQAAEAAASEESAWSYRGYKLRPGDFNTAMVHFYRGEITRSNVWRQRLDATTNWAVLTTAAVISIAFGQQEGNHGVVILNTLLITLFLYLEARRYRYYELWSYRVRLMETDFFAAMLVPPFQPAGDWAETLAESLLQPKFPISMLEAFGRRFRRNYIWLYLILAMVWLVKIWLHPTAPASWEEFVTRAAIGDIPGWLILLAGFTFNSVLMLIGLLTLGLRGSTGEVLPRYTFPLPRFLANSLVLKPSSTSQQAWFRPSGHRQQLIVHIITDHAQAIAKSILTELHRGVTALPGTGMYTERPHSVLMCVLTVTEIAQLKDLVKKIDQRAFVVVSPAQEVMGRGFAAL